MIASNPISAPQISVTVLTSSIYPAWKEQTGGTQEEFYKFMTTPSNERDEFLDDYPVEMSMAGRVLTQTIKGPDPGIHLSGPTLPELSN